MAHTWVIFYIAHIIDVAVALNVTIISNVLQNRNPEAYREIFCYPRYYHHESPVITRLLKEGVETPILSAKFYGWFNSTNSTPDSNSSCYSRDSLDISGNFKANALPCFTSAQLLETNDNFWWCGFINDQCGIETTVETSIRIQIKWYLVIPFLHLGNYSCEVEQNGTLATSTYAFYDGINSLLSIL